MNSQFAIQMDRATTQLNHCSFHLHDDMGDHGSVLRRRTPDLDVEILIGRFAVGGKDVIADPREVEDVPIKGLVVEVAPCAAHTAIVRGVSSCGFRRSSKNLLSFSLGVFPFRYFPPSFISFTSLCSKKAHLLFSFLSSYLLINLLCS